MDLAAAWTLTGAEWGREAVAALGTGGAGMAASLLFSTGIWSAALIDNDVEAFESPSLIAFGVGVCSGGADGWLAQTATVVGTGDERSGRLAGTGASYGGIDASGSGGVVSGVGGASAVRGASGVSLCVETNAFVGAELNHNKGLVFPSFLMGANLVAGV